MNTWPAPWYVSAPMARSGAEPPVRLNLPSTAQPNRSVPGAAMPVGTNVLIKVHELGVPPYTRT